MRWSEDSLTLRFEGYELADYGVDDVNEVVYRVGEPKLRKRKIGQVKDEPSG
ncbi:MAG: hypothetical protein HY698_05235 [Deltaproteobacteria bacterium]|nr:hypothetical protein [Deltaproteobacteria bacterium]